MYQTKRFGLVASKQEYMMLCRADRHMKKKKKENNPHEAFNGNYYSHVCRCKVSSRYQLELVDSVLTSDGLCWIDNLNFYYCIYCPAIYRRLR